MGNYNIQLKLFYKEFDGIQVYETTKTFRMVDGPFGGTFRVDEHVGSALSDEFTLSADNWNSHAQPADLKYQFFYRDVIDRSLIALQPPSA